MNVSTRKALKWIKSKGAVTADQLVEWDFRNGQKLFNWQDKLAASEYRLHQARVFMNHFKTKINGFRVRSFIMIPANPGHGIQADAYYPVETISETPKMREFVIGDIEKRMVGLGKELKMWKLSIDERKKIIRRVSQALEPD